MSGDGSELIVFIFAGFIFGFLAHFQFLDFGIQLFHQRVKGIVVYDLAELRSVIFNQTDSFHNDIVNAPLVGAFDQFVVDVDGTVFSHHFGFDHGVPALDDLIDIIDFFIRVVFKFVGVGIFQQFAE